VPLFSRDGAITHQDLWWAHEQNRAVRVGDWKLVVAGKEAPWELYNLRTDRGEMKNLAQEFPEKARELEQVWESRWEEFRKLATRDLPKTPSK
jgi:arylsulfatase